LSAAKILRIAADFFACQTPVLSGFAVYRPPRYR
jgi:hypothetical protein